MMLDTHTKTNKNTTITAISRASPVLESADVVASGLKYAPKNVLWTTSVMSCHLVTAL
jgi:hypothetical protein